MKFRISLRHKILGLVFITCCILCVLFIIFSLRQSVIAQDDRNRAIKKADTIAMDGSLERHQPLLEKAAVNLLNTDELLTYMADTTNLDAKMILEGMFLSFAEESIVRFTLSSATGATLLEQASNRPLRSAPTPDFLKPIYRKASADFSFHFYYRGVENSKESFPLEYCLVTVVTDDDDNLLGFAEFALDADSWLRSMAQLTQRTISLQDPRTGAITLTTDQNLTHVVNQFTAVEGEEAAFSLKEIEGNWWLTDRILIQDPSASQAAHLLVTQNVTNVVQLAQRNRLVSLIIGAVVILFSLTLTWFIIGRGVLGPIEQVVTFSRQLAQGHIVDTLSIKGRDEVADMGMALNNMADKLRLRAREAEAISTGDLTTRIDIESPDDLLGNSLQKIIDNLGEIIRLIQQDAELLETNSEQIRSFSGSIHSSSETINDRTTTLSGVSQEIAEDVEKLAAATEEMSASVREISENTARSKLVSTEAKELSERAGVTISSLDESMKKIEAASVAISDFADQTNLLSLNATIEAARAGEAGKGFAVVASEVKELANQSINTTKSISRDIEEIQQHTSQVVRHTDEVSKSITDLDESSLIVSEALTEQSSVADDLAGTISGTYERVRSFNEQITDISGSIDSNNEVINSLAGSSQELSELANRLKTVVAKFRI